MNLKTRGLCILFCILALILSGCKIEKIDETPIKTLEYEEIWEQDIPVPMLERMEEKKGSPFRITYQDEDFLYIGRSYGRREQKGCTIEIRECYESKNAIIFKTMIHGPDYSQEEEGSYEPYVVVRMESQKKYVMID